MWVRERARVCVCVIAGNFFCSFFIFAMLSAAAAVCLYNTVKRCGSHGITAAVLQGLCFVAAANGGFCVRVCVLCVRAILNTCQRGTNSNPYFEFQSIRVVQQRHNSSSSGTTQVNLATFIYIGTPAFPLFNLRHPRDFKSFTSREGEPCRVYTIRRTVLISNSSGRVVS